MPEPFLKIREVYHNLDGAVGVILALALSLYAQSVTPSAGGCQTFLPETAALAGPDPPSGLETPPCPNSTFTAVCPAGGGAAMVYLFARRFLWNSEPT